MTKYKKYVILDAFFYGTFYYAKISIKQKPLWTLWPYHQWCSIDGARHQSWGYFFVNQKIGYDLRRNVAHLAAQKDASEILDLVLSAKTADGKPILNANEPCHEKNGKRYTPVHFAAANFALNSMIVLSKFNPDINKKAIHKTPLMVALENRCQAVASYLLEQPEIDLTLRDASGHLAYQRALF